MRDHPSRQERPSTLLAVVCLAQFMVLLDVSIVNVALPSIQHDLSITTDSLQWVINIYTITFGGLLMLGGRAADLFGQRRVFIAGRFCSRRQSLACALASSQGELLAARAAQGIGSAVDPHHPGELALARAAFGSRVEADANRQPTDGLSDITLWCRASRRQRIAASHTAPVSQTDITIDGAGEPFVTVGTPNAHWVAARRHHDVTITIAAPEVAPASLIIEPIADPNAHLLGREPEEP